MATKTVKTTAKPATKKTTTRATAKKTVKKATTVKEPVTAAPVMEEHACACGASCHCGGKCGCGSKFGRFVKKLVVFLIVFALGFAAAKLCCNGPRHHGPRVHFVNGCVDVASVKCPKLVEALPAMDINQDGCITREEFAAVKQQMRAEIREMPVQVAE